MSVAAVTAYLETLGLGDRVRVLSHSSATVEEAAQALGCQPREIAKTMSLLQEQGPVLLVAAGDGKIDNSDRVKIRNHVLATSKLSGVYAVAADVNKDGQVNNSDRVKVRNHVLGTSLINQ